ncbi:MAG: magnesium/cobalt transporter CorA [Deltaproteobacteria bacterium]|nr:magnesium/cobalt transporter CorA [Deltaproteobacteria bacterium]
MVRFMKKVSRKAGLPPGTLVHIGEKREEKPKITLIDYDEERLEERRLEKVEGVASFRDNQRVTWLNVDGVHDVGVIEAVGKAFDLHPLVLEDILNTDQRPKMDDFDDYLCIILKMLSYDEEESHLRVEQVSLVMGKGFVVSLQEAEGDVFNPVRERLRKSKGRIRKMGSDYLLYSLMDGVVDNYFAVLEKIGEEIEILEEELMEDPTPETSRTIHHLKRELIFLRKSVWPLREVISALERGESDLIQERTAVFYKDVYDHTIQVVDTIETFRDMVSGMIDVYLSSVSNRMNEVMKVLTIIATIFIPLTFIAGIYGMNFKYMPELEWHSGYLLVWVVMVLVALVMVIYFRRKKWL